MKTSTAADYDNNRIILLLLVFGAFAAVAATFYVGLNVLPVRSLSMLSYLLLAMMALTAVLTWQPKLAAPLIIVSVFFSPDIVVAQIPGRPVNLRVEDGVLLAALFALLVRYAAGRERIAIPRTPLDKPILAFCTVAFVATLLGAYLGNVSIVRGLFFFAKRLEYFILLYLVYHLLEGKRQIETAIRLVFICMLLVSAYNIYMRLTAPATWRPYALPGMDRFDDYADIIVLVFPMILAVAIETRSRFYIVLAVLSSGPILFTLLDTLSRHSYIGLAASLVFLGIYRYPLLFPMIIAAIVHTAARLPHRIIERFHLLWSELWMYISKHSFDSHGSFYVRVEGVEEALSEFLYRPLLGRGLGSYSLASSVSHNQYGQILMETGILGLLFFLWFAVLSLKHAFQCIRMTHESSYRGVCIGYVAGVIGWLVGALAAIPFSAIRTMQCFMILTAIILACLKQTRSNTYISISDTC